MGKKLAAVGMAAAVTVGGFTVAAINPLGVAGAQDAPAAVTTSTGQKAAHDGPLARALAKLVADGTLTQAQADKVASTTKAEAKTAVEARREKRTERRTELLAVVSKALGSTPADVKAGFKDHKSIATQAKDKGVDIAGVDAAIKGELTTRLDAAVKDGKLTQERADQAKANLDKAVDKIVNADGTGGGLRERLRQRRGN
ncbi:hypothetical protein [Aquihabitans sp. McL0605]|uniref:hypothetical protein n=1 Tax=Aquihabitans sp. McL0605 TaxID=3415671 RepID=UPI003CEE6F3C